ncbi:MAG: AI-2E family transporter [Gammaproteobacteria bacterium]|nr:AI-2E family transporter [Gammaproteobacteria bacterium]
MMLSNRWFWLLLAIVVGVLLYLLSPVLTPFMVAAILAYIGDPLVDRLETYKLPRTLAVTVVFIALTLIAVIALLVLVPLLEHQFLTLGDKIPGYVDVIQTRFLPWLNSHFDLGLQLDIATIKSSLQAHWKEAGGLAKTIMGYLTQSGVIVVGWLANLVLVPVVTFYLLRDWDHLVARIHAMLPRKSEPVIVRLAQSSDEVLGAFLRGQLLVMLALAVIYSLGLWIAGLDLALLIGMLAGLVSFVPYLGFIVGIVVAGIAALLQFHDVMHLVYVAIVFGIGQAMEGMLLTPMLVGDRIGLHPVAVMFAVLAGGQLFGFLGVLLALPAAAVIAVILRYMHERYKNSELYSG